MISIFDPLRGLTFAALVAKLLVCTLCGTVIGLERSAKNRTAGFRTHILVCMAGTVAALVGLFLYLGLKMPADITRISGQIITGLGFIGAGSIIITKKMTIKGLTTAAGLWTCGIIGVAIGSGFYEGGVLATVLVLLTETWFVKLRGKIQKTPQFPVRVWYNDKGALDEVLRFFKDKHMAIENLKIRSQQDMTKGRYLAEITVRGFYSATELVATVRMMHGVVAVDAI